MIREGSVPLVTFSYTGVLSLPRNSTMEGEMRNVRVPEDQQIVLYKDRAQFPQEHLTENRAIVIRGRIAFDNCVLGWLIPKETAIVYT